MAILEHHFPPDIAEKYGVNAAIFLRDIYHWCETNRNNGQYFFEGRYWTYQTMAGLCKRHKYWTKHKVDHIIRTCEEEGLILKGNFNQNPLDRTTWYALTDRGLALFEPGEMETPISEKTELHFPDSSAPISEKTELHFRNLPPPFPKNRKCYKDNIKQENITSTLSTGASAREGPTLEMVREFARMRKSGVDPQKFFDYYAAAAWRDGENKPVYSWQQKFIAWENSERQRASPAGQGRKPRNGPPLPGDHPEKPDEAALKEMQRYLASARKEGKANGKA